MQSISCSAPKVATSRPVSRAAKAPVRDVQIKRGIGALAIGFAASLALSGPVQAIRLPPISNDPNRCDRAFVGNTIGQANAVSDTVLDLRNCVLSETDLAGKTLSGALLSNTDLRKANLREAVFSKAYAVGANFEGADLTNSVLDRIDFTNANLKNAKLVNAVITGAQFKGTNLEGVDFEDALIGSQDAIQLCDNPTLVGESRLEVGCRVRK
ncbi:hypothetical protein BSKO_12064 [Bryopsis sp. KO-2023]|nr:hypothetical protein BSKO_12064 [Bryopsis sp. KO-2023]